MRLSDAMTTRVEQVLPRGRHRVCKDPGSRHDGPGGTCAALDEAVRACAALLPGVVKLGEEEGAERSLKRGLRRTM
jgi:hypothetical protein